VGGGRRKSSWGWGGFEGGMTSLRRPQQRCRLPTGQSLGRREGLGEEECGNSEKNFQIGLKGPYGH